MEHEESPAEIEAGQVIRKAAELAAWTKTLCEARGIRVKDAARSRS